MNNKACIYTCQFGNYDVVKPIVADCDCYLITDRQQQVAGWTTILVRDLGFGSNRRNSRYYKINSHMLDYEYTIYLDASCTFNRPMQWRKLITGHYFSAFKHYMRNCLYKEAEVVRRLQLSKPTAIQQTVDQYRLAGFPKNYGLSENTFLVRRRCPELIAIEKAWWHEYINGTERDQLHLMFVLWQQGKHYLPYPLKGHVHHNSLFKRTINKQHRTKQPSHA